MTLKIHICFNMVLHIIRIKKTCIVQIVSIFALIDYQNGFEFELELYCNAFYLWEKNILCLDPLIMVSIQFIFISLSDIRCSKWLEIFIPAKSFTKSIRSIKNILNLKSLNRELKDRYTVNSINIWCNDLYLGYN